MYYSSIQCEWFTNPVTTKPLRTHLDGNTLTNIRNTLRAAQGARRATRVFAEAVFVKAFLTDARNGIRKCVRTFESYIYIYNIR